jgi:hypothetical protein
MHKSLYRFYPINVTFKDNKHKCHCHPVTTNFLRPVYRRSVSFKRFVLRVKKGYWNYFYCCTVHIVITTAFISTHALICTLKTLIHTNT